jgi:flagellar P-ring protein precursor FlgI
MLKKLLQLNKTYVLSFMISILFSNIAVSQVRIKDVAEFEGVRDNQLIGYGIVVGLDGTGDDAGNSPFTQQFLLLGKEEV